MKARIFVFVIVLLLATTASLAEEKAYIVENKIIYGKGGDKELKLDLAHPTRETGPLPALVFIHGGAWSMGSRMQYYFHIRKAAERGYVAVTVDYRLIKEMENDKVKYPFPAQIHDVKCVVRWLRANAKKYKIDPNRIGVIGYSSGGHLALLLGLTDSSAGLEGECGNLELSSRVQAVVSLSGSTELMSLYHETEKKGMLVLLLGGTPDEVPEQYRAASPVTHVSEDDPPVLSIHGEMDQTVPLKQVELLDAKMKEVGASYTLIIQKAGGHNMPVDDNVWNFLDEHLKGD